VNVRTNVVAGFWDSDYRRARNSERIRQLLQIVKEEAEECGIHAQ
jgi:hypothetical protein